MTEKQIKKLLNGLSSIEGYTDVALEKLGNKKDEIDLANKIRHFAAEAKELVKEVEKLTPQEMPLTPKGTKPAKPKGTKPAKSTNEINNVAAYLKKHPETIEKKVAQGWILNPNYDSDPDGENTTCRHYCGDYCDIGMDMTFCSKRCAYCTNMPGSSKAYA